MRPVLLEIDGFTSYKNKATIDFRDTDFFALVGPTGSGKSTILDAMAFALYRSAPRWNDVGAVAPALAPTANRAVVRLIFDANGKRYSVIRDVRRGGGKTGQITVKEQRLERFHNADDDGTGETDVLESGNAVTAKVTEVLGLTFQDFCTCVVLPQGDFSKFLHATPGERQAILKKLLGYQIYDSIRSAADARSRDHEANHTALTRHLESLGSVGESVIAAQQEHLQRLETLDERMSRELLPAHAAATTDAAAVTQQIAQVSAEQALLAAVTVPADVPALQQARTATAEAIVDAQAAESIAEDDDQATRAALSAAPSRSELAIVRDRWRELASVQGSLPDLVRQFEAATAAATLAQRAADEAARALPTARAEYDSAKAAAENAQRVAAQAKADAELLSAVRAPSGIDQLATALRAATDALDVARQNASDAETGEQQARDRLAAAPDLGTLSAATDLVKQIASAETFDLTVDEEKVAALRHEVAAAEAAVEDAENKVRDESLTTHVHALRQTLAVGGECPVCEQQVSTLPEVAVVESSAQPLLTAAKANLKSAQDRFAKADRDATARAAQRDATAKRLADDQARLDALLSQLGVSEDALGQAALDRAALQTAADRAAARLRTTRAAVTDAEETLSALQDQRRKALAELHSARDNVLTLGAPALDDSDVAGAWKSLIAWASESAASLPIGQLASDASNADAAFRAKAAALDAAVSTAEEANQRLLDAAVSNERAENAVANARNKCDELIQALAGALDAGAVEIELKKVALLESNAEKARTNLTATRNAVRSAQAAHKRAAENASASWAALRRARDPLTALGAPEPGSESDDLELEWTKLATWSADQSKLRAAKLADLRYAAGVATQRVAEAAATVTGALRDAQLDGTPETATKVLAREIAQADATLKQALADFEKARKLRADADREKEKAQVASELSRLMRSTNFPQWLVNSALDVLVGEASAILFELSNRQFELATKDGEIVVVDHNNADLTRLVKTLSGGETFQASLALALALSRQMSTLSSTGSAKLEAIFLDEGFGTLDPETLDEVATTLENLASSGSRMVGVVTHVGALADRIPVQFRVSRDDSGSRVEMVRN